MSMYGDERKALLGGIVEPVLAEEAQVGNSFPADDPESIGMSVLWLRKKERYRTGYNTTMVNRQMSTGFTATLKVIYQLVLLPNIPTSLSLPLPFVIDSKGDKESLCLGLEYLVVHEKYSDLLVA
ncbi:uncharacterized protein ARMOST_06221 [Armillaria ostoyae]|uniref:Uncharacterized protein n=1 Tax=Armillaria ostoyae TaxID=47428 RepID=A0A284R2E1_ARMOS|nr:uncharacterized protein ARMOST_06221 [Armillaria ostoyae]